MLVSINTLSSRPHRPAKASARQTNNLEGVFVKDPGRCSVHADEVAPPRRRACRSPTQLFTPASFCADRCSFWCFDPPQLSQLRGRDRGFTLLHAVVEQVMLHEPGLAAFTLELAEFEAVPGGWCSPDLIRRLKRSGSLLFS